jgi:hypothetical protein
MRALTHRMSQRLVAGDGVCTYQVGVDEYGCHSLHDYRTMSESAWVLERIAGGLNCIVVSRHMIQNEILEVEEWEDCGGGVGNGNPHRLTNDPTGAIVVEEPSVLGGCGRSGGGDGMGGKNKLSTEEGTYTRCVLVIQRVETHALNPSSLSSTQADIGGGVGGGGGGGSGGDVVLGGDDVPTTGYTRSVILGCASDGGDGEMMVDGLPATVASPSVSVEETLSSRNVRIAVLGNVDAGKSTLIGTLTRPTSTTVADRLVR